MAVSSPGSLGLPRARGIKQGRDFARTKAQGKRVVSGCLIANWVPLSSGAPSRVGVITGRKVGAAVVRVRARRLLREAFRLHQPELAQPVDLVLVARPSIAGKPFAGVAADYRAALCRAKLYRDAATGNTGALS